MGKDEKSEKVEKDIKTEPAIISRISADIAGNLNLIDFAKLSIRICPFKSGMFCFRNCLPVLNWERQL